MRKVIFFAWNPKPTPPEFTVYSGMASPQQRARMAVIRAALDVVRAHRRHLTFGSNLVVFGGAYALDTKHHSDNFATIRNDFSPCDLPSPLSTIPFRPPTYLHMVVSGGARAPAIPPSIVPFAPMSVGQRLVAPLLRTFNLSLPASPHINALALVVLGSSTPRTRVGIG